MAELLFDYQADALKKMKNGCILNGDVGSGKSRTAIAYYYKSQGGKVFYIKKNKKGIYIKHEFFDVDTDKKSNKLISFPIKKLCDLYIITTAKNRDSHTWDYELAKFGMSSNSECNFFKNKIIIDSWNNIKKYIDISNAFFILDEQRLVGYGVWVKSFLKIAKNNKWILLSATPGDTWSDYIPVFIANGFYKNKTDFSNQHIIWSTHTPYPCIKKYFNEGILIKHRNDILIDMHFERKTIKHACYVSVEYDIYKYKQINSTHWNIYTNEPIKNASEFCFTLRKLVNSDITRLNAVLDILANHPKVIIFYSFNYELELLRKLLVNANYPFSEWNGQKHQEILNTTKWVYLVEYTAGCEGWNCIQTDTIIFYSLNHSYKVMHQAMGRIDRLNTPFQDLYYYILISKSKIDIRINQKLKQKKNFNNKDYAPLIINKKNKILEEII